jgi:glycosyltransferase involved in cell wall biosynthesis
MNKPRITVIIPCYNAEKYLTQAVDSILRQKEESWEVLLIDDGSTDGTPRICEVYSKQDNRIRTYHQHNSGVSKARNLGIDQAAGEWIAFLDADDWLTDDAFSVFEKAILDSDSEIHLFNNFQNNGNQEQKGAHFSSELLVRQGDDKKWFVIDTLFPYYDVYRNGIKTGNVRAVHGKLYNRSLIVCNKLKFDESLPIAEDALFNYKAYHAAHSISLHDRYVMHYRINENSVMHRYNPEIDNVNNTIMQAFADEIGVDLDNDKDFQIAFLGMASECMFRSLKLYYLHPENKENIFDRRSRLVKFLNTTNISKAIKSCDVSVLPIGKKQMVWCFKHKLIFGGMLIGKLSILYLKYRGDY